MKTASRSSQTSISVHQQVQKLGLTYSSPVSLPGMPVFPPNTLWGYVDHDSDSAGCPDTRRSISGFIFMLNGLNGAATPWHSKRQTTVALSSAEAEFISASAMVREIPLFFRKNREILKLFETF